MATTMRYAKSPARVKSVSIHGSLQTLATRGIASGCQWGPAYAAPPSEPQILVIYVRHMGQLGGRSIPAHCLQIATWPQGCKHESIGLSKQTVHMLSDVTWKRKGGAEGSGRSNPASGGGAEGLGSSQTGIPGQRWKAPLPE